MTVTNVMRKPLLSVGEPASGRVLEDVAAGADVASHRERFDGLSAASGPVSRKP